MIAFSIVMMQKYLYINIEFKDNDFFAGIVYLKI